MSDIDDMGTEYQPRGVDLTWSVDEVGPSAGSSTFFELNQPYADGPTYAYASWAGGRLLVSYFQPWAERGEALVFDDTDADPIQLILDHIYGGTELQVRASLDLFGGSGDG